MLPLRTATKFGRVSSVTSRSLSMFSHGRDLTEPIFPTSSTVRQSKYMEATNQQSKRFVASLTKPIQKSSVAVDAPTLKNPSQEQQPPLDDGSSTPVPKYLQEVYWWAYLHPNAIRVFERQWLVDAILWGNFNRLRDAALDELSNRDGVIDGRTLQVACVYGNFTQLLAKRLAPNATLDVVDVAPIQIENLTEKLRQSPYEYDPSSIQLSRYNAADLRFENDAFDQVIFFFLLHEMPEDVRRQALSEASRVLKKQGGKLVFVDYHRPTSPFHPHRYIMPLVLETLEPFAMDLWNYEIQDWLPEDVVSSCRIEKELFFGGLYQKVIVTRE